MNSIKKEKQKHLIKMIIPICAAVCLVVIAAIAMSGLYGWFTENRTPYVQESNFFVRVESDPNITIDALDVNGALLENPPTMIMPGDYLRFRINLFNHNTTATVKRTLNIKNLFVLYPTQKEVNSVPFVFDNELVNTDNYYITEGLKFDILNTTNFSTQADRYNFFTTFMAPATNALRYSIRSTFNAYFGLTESSLYTTALQNATSAEIVAPQKNNVLPTPAPLTISDMESITYFSVPPNTTDPNSAVKVYLVLYFDPLIGGTSSFSGTPVFLKNSNPFYGQDLELYINYSNV
ncbi:MAG: hypothetical protein LBF12_05390 [Christensenellaceae bacterium]|jgi:hypothetical protein|nr:hypothetical protein [Christensenellaceae bacterium]